MQRDDDTGRLEEKDYAEKFEETDEMGKSRKSVLESRKSDNKKQNSTKNVQFGCLDCSVTVPTKTCLHWHYKNSHGSESGRAGRVIVDEKFQKLSGTSFCSFCGITFNSMYFLKQHQQKSHKNGKNASEDVWFDTIDHFQDYLNFRKSATNTQLSIWHKYVHDGMKHIFLRCTSRNFPGITKQCPVFVSVHIFEDGEVRASLNLHHLCEKASEKASTSGKNKENIE